ncbi:MAG: hypothetical protein ACYTG6_06325 [Planctomycetota bacterium]
MTAAARSSHRAARGIGRGLVLVGAAALPLALLADALFGVEVTVLHHLYTPAEREAWRREVYDPRDDVAEIYGRPESAAPVRALVFDRSRLIRPAEAPARRLLFVDRRAGETVWARRTLYVGALLLTLGALGAGALLLRWTRPLPGPPRA